MNFAQCVMDSAARLGADQVVQARYGAVIPMPLADIKLGLRLQGDALCMIDFLDAQVVEIAPRCGTSRRAVRQLLAYFADPRRPLNVPISAAGTPFQHRVWAALCAIPPGETRRYGELARALKSSARAVGGACRANPIPLFIPCHRVVAANGDGGFMGYAEGPALAFKRWLLQHERHGHG